MIVCWTTLNIVLRGVPGTIFGEYKHEHVNFCTNMEDGSPPSHPSVIGTFEFQVFEMLKSHVFIYQGKQFFTYINARMSPLPPYTHSSVECVF